MGNQADGNSDFSSISADGRYVAFYSMATNLVANDTNDTGDTFVHDRQTGQTIRVSVDSSGNQGNDTSLYSMISGNGQVVMFDSYASNLVANDTSDRMDVFAHDLVTGQTTRVSVDSSGNQATSLYPLDGSYGTSISFDGRYIGFSSYANNLVPNDTNFMDDVFVHDRQTAQTTRVSVDSAGVQSNGYSPGVFVSDDGRYASFVSGANNLVADDFNNLEDVFIRDRQTNQTTRISLSSAGAESDAISGGYSFVSADGRYVFFQAYATTLTPTDTSGATVAYIRDRNTNTTTRISINPLEFSYRAITDISSDMRYILFRALSNLVASDTNDLFDIYLLDRQTDSLMLISGVITAPAAPTLIAPANGATVPTTTVNFSWGAVNTATSYRIQIATDNSFTDIVYNETTASLSHLLEFMETGTYYWRVRGINSFGSNGAWSATTQFVVGEINSFAVDEQQLFTAMQAQMTEPLQFVLFDITPTGIVTTLQFTDGAVVTTTVQMTLQNGLITIRLDALSGGSAIQQEWVMQHLPSLLMGMLDDVLPDNYSSMQTMTLTGNSISFEVISEVD